MQSARRRIVDVGHRDVGAIGVDRDTPLNAAEPAASAGAIAPDLSTLPVGIERVHDARLLTRDDQLTAVGQSGEHGRRAEVEIGTRASATIHLAWRAAEHVGRPRRHLLRPPHLSRLQIERENRVSGRRGRTAVRVAGRDVQGAALDVDRRRRPDSAAGGPAQLCAVGIRAQQNWFVGDRVGLPHHAAGSRVERNDAAAEAAACVSGRPAAFFVRRCGDVEAAVVERGRAGQPHERMLVDLPAPQQSAGRRVQRVREPFLIRKVRGVGDLPAGPRPSADRDGRAHAAERREGPRDTAARGVERTDRAVLAADKQPAAGNRRLRPGRRRVGETKRPLEILQSFLVDPERVDLRCECFRVFEVAFQCRATLSGSPELRAF